MSVNNYNNLLFNLFVDGLSDSRGNPNWKKNQNSSPSWSTCKILDINGNAKFNYAARFSSSGFALYNQEFEWGGRNYTIRFWFVIDNKTADTNSNKCYTILYGFNQYLYWCMGNFYIDGRKITEADITKDIWHHFAISYNHRNGRIYYYYDDKLLFSLSKNINKKPYRYYKEEANAVISIGSYITKTSTDTGWENFYGWLRNFQIWDGVSLYNGESTINVDEDLPSNAQEDTPVISYNNVKNYTGAILAYNSGSEAYMHGNKDVVKNAQSIKYNNPIKYQYSNIEKQIYDYNDSIAYFDGKSGEYLNPRKLFNNDFTIEIEMKPATSNTNYRTLLCLRNICPMKISGEEYYPLLNFALQYNTDGINEYWKLDFINAKTTTLSGYYGSGTLLDTTGNKSYLDGTIFRGYTQWTIVTLCYKKSENAIYVYMNGKQEGYSKLIRDLSNVDFYPCIGFNSVNDNNSKFIGYIGQYELKLNSFAGNNEGIIPDLYSGYLLTTTELDKYKLTITTNEETYNKLMSNDLDLLQEKAQVIGNITYRNNIPTETYNNIVYNNNVDKFAEGFLLSAGAGIFNKRPMEICKKNFTISCWVKKNGNSIVIPFRLVGHHPTQIKYYNSWPYVDDIYIELGTSEIRLRNVIHKGISGTYTFTDESLYTTNAKGGSILGGSVTYNLNNVSNRQLKYSIENLWNHVALIKSGSSFYVYINGKRIIKVTSELNYNLHWHYLWIGGNTGSFYIKDLSIQTDVVACSANEWPEYYGEEVDFNFTNAKFTFDSNINDSNTNNTWLTLGSPTIQTNLTFDTFNTIKNPAFTDALYIDGQGLYLRNPIKLFDKDFTISGWFFCKGVPGGTAYKNLIKLTQMIPITVDEDKFGRYGDLTVALYTQSYASYSYKTMTNSIANDYSLGIGGYFDSYKTWVWKYEDGSAREDKLTYNVFSQKNIFDFINYGNSSTTEAIEGESFDNLYSYDMKDYWCHICLCYKTKENKLYFYYNGKLKKADEFKVIDNVKNKNYYILLGMSFYNKGDMSFKGYVKNFEVIYGTAKYTGETIPEIYTEQLQQFFNYNELKVGVYDYYDFANIGTRSSDQTDIWLFSDTEFRYDLFKNIFNEKVQTHDTSNITPINTPQIMEYSINNMFTSNSVYFDGNVGLQSIRPQKLFLDKRNFTMHLWFNYTGEKNPSYKKYLFRIMALDPKEGYNTSGKTGYVDCYLLGNKIYFNHKYGTNYSFNSTGADSITSLGNPNISTSVDIISKNWYNNIDVGSYYDDWPISSYWCNVAISYDATNRIMYFYYNGKLVLKTDKYGTNLFAKLLMYYITIGFGSYTNRNNNWKGYISHIYISNTSCRYTNEKLPQLYPGQYFPIKNVSTTLPLNNYASSSEKIDANGLKFWNIHSSGAYFANTTKEAPIFDDSKNLSSSTLFNGITGIYSSVPIHLSHSNFTIDFWALSTSTKKTGYETLLKIIPNNPNESVNLSNTMYQKKSFYNYTYANNIGKVLYLCTIEIFYDYQYNLLYCNVIQSEKMSKPSFPTFVKGYPDTDTGNITHDYLSWKYTKIGWNTLNDLNMIINADRNDYMDKSYQSSLNIQNKWIHIVLSYNQVTGKIFYYINGYLAHVFYPNTKDFLYQPQTILIGMDRLDNTYKWNGYIRDFNITYGNSKYMDSYIPGMRAIQELSNMPSFNGNLRDNLEFSGYYNSSSISWSIKGKPVLKDTSTLKTFNIVKNKPVNRATYFDGSVIYFEEKKVPMFKKDWTLEFWAKCDNSSGTRYLFRSSAAHPSISTSGTVMPDFSIYYSSNKVYFNLKTITSSSSSSSGSASSKFNKTVSLPLMKEKWCHIAVSYIAETNTFYFYVNGALQFTQESSIELAEEKYYLYIGGQFKDNSSYNWIGYLRDFEFTSGKAKYTEDTIPHIYALPTLTNFTAILPFTNNLDDIYGNKWITKSEPEVKDIGKEIFTFSVKKNSKFSNGLYLDGNAGLYSESTVELFTKNCTISFWAYFSGTTNISKYLLEIMPVHPEESSSNYTLPCLEVVYNNNFIKCNLYTITGRTQNANYGYNKKFSLYTSLPTLKTKWHHIAIVYTVSNNKFYFYVDGQLVGTEVSYLDLTFFPYHIWVGMYYNIANKYDWEGYIRNLEIYGTQAKYTSDTISAIYAEPDLDITHKHKIRRLLAALLTHNFKTKKFDAINAPTLYNLTIRRPVRTDRNKWLSRRFLRALRSSFFNVKRRKSRTQIFQINDTKRLLAKYLEFKFNVTKDVERTRKAIGIYIRALK